MSRLLRVEAIRSIEQAWLAATPAGTLMQRAAAAVADEAARLARRLPRATPIVALVGPGNNGGDALLALGLLRARGFAVRALALSADLPAASDAARVRARWDASGAPLDPLSELPAWLAQRPLVIDGLFGIGLQRPVGGVAADAIGLLNAAGVDVLAVDVPSGLDADTGAVVGGRSGVAVRAACTVTMIADKPGLHTASGVDCAGRVVVATLGTDGPFPLDASSASEPHTGAALARAAPDGAPTEGMPAGAAPTEAPDPMPPAPGHAPDCGVLFSDAQARALLRPRARNTHKGSFGSVLVIGGAQGMTGAALLAARGAQAAGAGKVFIASPDAPVFDPGQPQLMTRDAARDFDGIDAIAIGCGLGQSPDARVLLERALDAHLPLVLDADALNLVAQDPSLAQRLAGRAAPAALTPHPLEAARLLGVTTSDVQADRCTWAVQLATRLNAAVVIKGAGSVVAAPDGAWSINATGGPALATGGTGDVLAGVVAALLARGIATADALRLGVWLHGRAGDLWHAHHGSATGLSAAELPHWLVAASRL
jgi:hydroxyethylthiazole kinase-like uncharacterized protein yjeF